MASEITGSGMTSDQCSRGSCVVNTVDLPIERSSRISHRSCASVEESFLIPMSSNINTSGLEILSRYRKYVPLERASATFSSHVVTVMYNTDLPHAHACSPMACAIKVFPTPV